jgi:hypothetical protein
MRFSRDWQVRAVGRRLTENWKVSTSNEPTKRMSFTKNEQTPLSLGITDSSHEFIPLAEQ